MKFRSRDINIFSIAALDLFASALGAFILIAVVLFPYFPNTGDAPERVAAVRAALERTQSELEAARSALDACQAQNSRTQEEFEACRQEVRKKFVLVVMSWGGTDDVDLHVVDPVGREFYFGQRSFSGSRAKLEEDNIRGPGNEIWLHPAAEPGTYRVYYHYYRRSSYSGVRVRGAVLTPRGRTEFPDRRLTRVNEKPHVATITVDADGIARVAPR